MFPSNCVCPKIAKQFDYTPETIAAVIAGKYEVQIYLVWLGIFFNFDSSKIWLGLNILWLNFCSFGCSFQVQAPAGFSQKKSASETKPKVVEVVVHMTQSIQSE